MFLDAHNHLQDARFAGTQPALLAPCAEAGVSRMVVNGTCESDWPAVLELDRRSSLVLPSFGLHPWYVHERTSDWQAALVRHLDAVPSAIGEIGLDRWILDRPANWAMALSGRPSGAPAALAEQEVVFLWQLHLAAERNLPASIHCLQAWGRLHELLREHPRPARGFLLHSFGGPVEMVPALARLGAYFSFSGYFAHERKGRQRETFRHIPLDRLLLETDAPDQLPPAALISHPLAEAPTGKPLNHPANLPAIYRFLADFLGESEACLVARVAENFHRLFAGL
jgi:TatD DNase family protein